MQMKYSKELAEFADCPPRHAKPRDWKAYRYVFEPADERSFLPVAKISPSRKFDNEQGHCIAYSLSMFASKEGAIDHYQRLRSKYKWIRQTVGTHLAEGQVTVADGLATAPNDREHFSFFEADCADLAATFQIVEAL
jgi:hypothetical protein